MWWGSPRRPSYFWGAVLVLVGVFALLGNLGVFNNLDWNYVWPVFLIALGFWLIVARVLPGGAETYGGPGGTDRSDTREGITKAKLQLAVGAARLEVRGAPLGDQASTR